MDFEQSQEQQNVYQSMLEFGRKISAIEASKDQLKLLWRQAGDIGLLGLPVSKEFGGGGFSALDSAIALEGLGKGSIDNGLNFSFAAHLLAGALPVDHHGRLDQKEAYLQDLCSGNKIISHAMTEPGGGSDAFNLKTRAEKKDQGFVINGSKCFVSNAHISDLLLVYAMTDPEKAFLGGISVFIIPSDTKGVQIGDPYDQMGLSSCRVSDVFLEDVIVSSEQLIGGEGAGTMIFQESMDLERSLISALHIGTMERLIEETVAYAKKRNVGKSKIASYQAISHRIADMKLSLEAARLLVYKAAWTMDKRGKGMEEAAGAKLFTSEAFERVSRDSMRVYGGYGYMRSMKIEGVLRDAIASTIYSGTSEIQRDLIARCIGL